jgi:hypothetical protein
MDKWMVSFSCSESEGGIFCDGQVELSRSFVSSMCAGGKANGLSNPSRLCDVSNSQKSHFYEPLVPLPSC